METNNEKAKMVLLCTFSDENNIEQSIRNILKFYKVIGNKIYIYKSLDGKKVFLTYNVIQEEKDGEKRHLPKTIIVQRKKESNTIYTINALNQLIYLLNDGNIDKKYIIPWQRYKDSALIITNNGFEAIKMKLVEIRNGKYKKTINEINKNKYIYNRNNQKLNYFRRKHDFERKNQTQQ